MAIEGRLEIIQGAEAGQVVPLGATPVTFGRAPGNVVVVRDAAVSRQHAKIFERDGRHFVADLNSSHGTFVNGAKITLQELHPGDEVKLGATTFRYGDPVAPPPPPPLPLPPAPAPAPSPARDLPPVNTTYRRALTETGEDPFALEEPPASSTSPATAPPASAAPVNTGAPAMKTPAPPPQIEFRGRTAEQFAARAGGAPAPAAAGRAAGAHVPPPLANIARRRGPFSFLSDELDQRGPFARVVATLFALAAAGGLLWLALQLTSGGSKDGARTDENAPAAPERPSLPPRH